MDLFKRASARSRFSRMRLSNPGSANDADAPLPGYADTRRPISLISTSSLAGLPGYAALFPNSDLATQTTSNQVASVSGVDSVTATQAQSDNNGDTPILSQSRNLSLLVRSPSYTTLANVPSSLARAASIQPEPEPSAPPGYTTPSRPTRSHRHESPNAYTCRLTTSSGHPWLEAKIHSEAISSTRPPMTLGKPITGEVILDFVREERLKLVTITVIGVLSFVQAEQVTFFKQSQTLWDSTMGDPRSPTTPSSHRPNTPPENQPQQQLQNVKVHGTYTFPLSVQIPRQSTLSANASTLKEFRLPVDKNTLSLLPPSYDGKPWHISVNYAMTIRVKKGGAFSTESKLKIPIEYSPSSAPDPPSLLRQSTYNEKRPPPPQATGPELDPEGWTTMPSTEFSGVAFRRRNVTVNCSLSFARPLAYTRGSYIPLMLSLRSTDAQTLDILSSPPPPVSSTYRPSSTPSSSKPSQDHSLNVHLTRTVIEGENLEFSRPFFVNHDMPTLLVVDRLPPIASAVWRRVESGIVQSNSSPSETEEPSSSRRPDPIHERVLFGEIKLPTDLTPSFTFGKIQLVYSVDMRPPSVPGFVPSDEAPISQTEVMIHPCFAEGPRPQSSV